MSTTFRDLIMSKGLLGGKYGSPGVGSKDVQDEEGGEVQEREVQGYIPEAHWNSNDK